MSRLHYFTAVFCATLVRVHFSMCTYYVCTTSTTLPSRSVFYRKFSRIYSSLVIHIKVTPRLVITSLGSVQKEVGTRYFYIITVLFLVATLPCLPKYYKNWRVRLGSCVPLLPHNLTNKYIALP